MSTYDVAVVGGGASGIFAAIAAAQRGKTVVILEKLAQTGRSIMRSGNGRCNLTNAALCPQDYNDPTFVSSLIQKNTSYNKILQLFEELGVWTVCDEEQRVFPESNYAGSVVKAIDSMLAHLKVTIITDALVTSVEPHESGGFEVSGKNFTNIQAGACIIAGGARSARFIAERFDLPYTDETPGLCSLTTSTWQIKGLSGVRTKPCKASIFDENNRLLATETGELLFREYGVSGIMIFNLSRYAQKNTRLELDLLPHLSEHELEEKLCHITTDMAHLEASDYLTGIFHPSLARRIMELTQENCKEILEQPVRGKAKRRVFPRVPITDINPARIAACIKRFSLPVLGLGEIEHAQVTQGGVQTAAIDPLTLEVRSVPGLFITGEALDIDGRCGGFNLSWAWLSGHAAGCATHKRSS